MSLPSSSNCNIAKIVKDQKSSHLRNLIKYLKLYPVFMLYAGP